MRLVLSGALCGYVGLDFLGWGCWFSPPGYSELINRLIAAASGALYAKSEITVNM